MPDMDGETFCRRVKGDALLAGACMVLLTSWDGQRDAGRIANLGFAGWVGKPVKPRELMSCIEGISRDRTQERQESRPIVASVNAGLRAPAFSGRVLLVEDNIVNQKVARHLLERLGCDVTIAVNGREGVAAHAEGRFDLVLMDIQMPIMDGYAAARCIRGSVTGNPRVPLIALTANAMIDELDKCLAAGMDGLVTKPIDMDKLEEVLERAGLSARAPGSAAHAPGEVS
jgi:CheY-like chemotaxis protein